MKPLKRNRLINEAFFFFDFKFLYKTGYPLSNYQVKNCNKCPIQGVCYGSKENRSVERNHHLVEYKEKIRKLLNSQEGIKKRKQRSVEVEPVFVHLKMVTGVWFTRFSTQLKKESGLKKTTFLFFNNELKIRLTFLL
ncbi:transposase [Chryseobacterium rhizoplanae]|uniref:transposase n=1 Tax=Chryseobacterium rhizoplanae TaxID=1609531 RepID=UPI001CE2FF9D|nr:transposase [Chryseobacterium rhizoplanae]